MNMNEKDYQKCKVRYISDKPSIFFSKGEVYDAYIPLCNGGKDFYAFYFTEDEMDEEGMYALPAERFERVDT